MESFLGSNEYIQGIRDNGQGSKNTTTVTAAPYVSVEQQQAQTWSDPDTAGNVAYQTWVPIATTRPLPTMTPVQTYAPSTATPYVPSETDGQANPGGTWAGIGATATPTARPTAEPIATREPEQRQDEGGNGWIWVIALLIIIGGGAATALYFHQKNKRAAAQRAAVRRAQGSASSGRTGNAGSTSARPYQHQFSQNRPDTAANAGRTPTGGTYGSYDSRAGYGKPVSENPAPDAGAGSAEQQGSGRRSRRAGRNQDQQDGPIL